MDKCWDAMFKVMVTVRAYIYIYIYIYIYNYNQNMTVSTVSSEPILLQLNLV